MTQHTTEVAVVGASIAGLYSALLLARKGREVTLLERAPEGTPTNRTLIVTAKTLDLLRDLGESAVLNQIHRFKMTTAPDSESSIELARPDLVIERSALIQSLAKSAADEGVKILYDCRFREVQGHAQGLTLTARRGSTEDYWLKARTLIGADGAHSRVARSSGLKLHPTAPLLQAIVELPGHVRQDTSLIWFRTEDTPYFYWLIPENPSVGALGVIGRKSDGLRRNLDALIDKEGFRILGYQGAHIPIYNRWLAQRKRLGSGEVFLVGDAAGHVKVSTVGGIVTGVRGAIACAEEICGERTGATASLRAELYLHMIVRRALHQWSNHDYRRLLGALNPSSAEVLAQISRDEMPQLIWRLAVAQPGLIRWALKGFLERKPF